ncbi:DUF5906 domain-containing protein [Streptomyces shenzhenensis]|uniref:DUF5906 domain-containing protein n=1 Tax=Streptomyces shenzhenensis TaxID=943815 RepID=UPI00368F4E6A
MQEIFAPVVTTMNGAFWELTRYGRKGSDVGKLHGARLVFSSEMTSARLDEAFLKAYVAADTMSADPKYKAPYDFKPAGMLVLSGNDKPTIKGTDDGIWARFMCVPWDESFVGREDRTLKPDLVRAEHAEGVIAWAVRGAVDYFAEGLPVPQRVSAATEEYREESNPFAEWIDANFARDTSEDVTNAEIKERAKAAGYRNEREQREAKRALMRHFGVTEANSRISRDGMKSKGLRGVALKPEPSIYPNHIRRHDDY